MFPFYNPWKKQVSRSLQGGVKWEHCPEMAPFRSKAQENKVWYGCAKRKRMKNLDSVKVAYVNIFNASDWG